MDIELARKFILEFIPPGDQLPMNHVFEEMQRNPLMILNNGLLFTQFNYFKRDDKKLAVAAANGVVLGFALAYCMQYPEVVRMINSYLDEASKSRGENVVNFLHKKGS